MIDTLVSLFCFIGLAAFAVAMVALAVWSWREALRRG